ncbi:MAG: TIGR00730 family Rossman fold protein [Magnetospirillum gryphiswaldense]|nr:TIGR00730 family Rossman fold protein [Magnetospirillum gryphiswaldense]
MKRVCVFCGSNAGTNPAYAQAARALGRLLAERGLGLVYGGGNVGLMGIVAEAAMQAGGTVIGVIPESLMRLEVGARDITELHVVESMHERELADGFIALPGGIGTMEELFEVWTWGQLGLHGKPAAFLDVAGYYSHLHTFLDHMVSEGFLEPRHRQMVAVSADAARLLDGFAAYQPPSMVKIIDTETA